MRCAAVLFVVLASSAAFASEPGQPVDCSDWQPTIPGIACREAVPIPCTNTDGQTSTVCNIGNTTVTDNEGYTYYITYEREFPVVCAGQPQLALTHAILRRVRDGADQEVGRFSARCGSIAGQVDELRWSHDCSFGAGATAPKFSFDLSRGSLQLGVCSYCEQENGNLERCSTYGELQFAPYNRGSIHRIALEGLTTIYEIQQSYSTIAGTLGFRVPAMPEGMAGADHFDTYWGNLAYPIDFARAHTLACDYPATAPHVGDYLTVADTVPTPAPGHGVYYVTSATYQGATRYGRKTTNRDLTGRDPALLPTCTP